jgi:cholesterol 7-dehydrogenase
MISAPEFAKLKIWTTVEMNGFIYVWYHAENAGPSWLPEPVPEIETGKWHNRGRCEFLIGCHAQVRSERQGFSLKCFTDII